MVDGCNELAGETHFENLVSNQNPVTPIKDEWNETSSNCKAFRYGVWQIYQRSASCDKIIGSYSIYQNQYDSLDNVFKNNLYNMSQINSLLNTWSSQIENVVALANEKFDKEEISVSEWKSAINKLKSDIEKSL